MQRPIFYETLLGMTFLTALVWLFYPGLVNSQVPAFRDAYHFYYPQAVWLDACAQRGEYFPVWNAHEGLGVSVAGQPSAGLYYPLRLFWCIPWLSVAQRFSLVIVVHLLIAALGIRFAASKLNLSRQASWLAAISYALSCPVLFQHTNLIYLCSAAWIGFALGALSIWLRSPTPPTFSSCCLFASASSLMLLAGDAHTAVNTFIVAGLVMIVSTSLQPTSEQIFARARSTATWLASAFFFLAFVTAIQWLPTVRWAQHSVRSPASSAIERSTTELAPILAQATPKSKHTYDFSLSPWHLATCIWPTLGGHYLPENSRIYAAIPAEGRMWLPSVYFGLLPVLLCLQGWTHWIKIGTPAYRQRWLALRDSQHLPTLCLTLIALFSILAALGNYSLVWLMREICDWLNWNHFAAQLPKDHIGGLYALLVALLPAYEVFRYPAKWTVWFVAACCVFAGVTLDKSSGSHKRPLSRRLCSAILALSLLGLMGSCGLLFSAQTWSTLEAWLSNATRDAWLGSAHLPAVARCMCFAFGVPSLVLVIALRQRLANGLLYLTMLEMTLCASCWISFARPAGVCDVGAGASPQTPPLVWSNTTAADITADGMGGKGRRVEIEADYQDTFLLGKLASLSEVGSLGATQSIEPQAMTILRSWLSSHDRLTRTQPELDRVLGALGVTHRLTRTRRLDQVAAFAWVQLENSTPLCMVLASSLPTSRSPAISSWQWTSSSQLDIELVAQPAAVLQVRQFNDGGWEARNEQHAVLPIDSQHLFVRVRLAPKTTRVQLRRKLGW